MITKRTVIRFKLFFRWYDLWIGAYVDKDNQAVYICPVPMLGIKIYRTEIALCHACKKEAVKTAVFTGDGWGLYWECQNDACEESWDVLQEIEWPFGDRFIKARDLRDAGYEVV